MIAVMGFYVLDSDYVQLQFGEAKLAGRVVNGADQGKIAALELIRHCCSSEPIKTLLGAANMAIAP